MGYNKRRFQLFKFRTMVVDAEARMKEIEHLNEKEGPIFKITNDPRITRLGRFLRKTSIDELPQLINVVLGDMSLVGPRPLSMRDALGLASQAVVEGAAESFTLEIAEALLDLHAQPIQGDDLVGPQRERGGQ